MTKFELYEEILKLKEQLHEHIQTDFIHRDCIDKKIKGIVNSFYGTKKFTVTFKHRTMGNEILITDAYNMCVDTDGYYLDVCNEYGIKKRFIPNDIFILINVR